MHPAAAAAAAADDADDVAWLMPNRRERECQLDFCHELSAVEAAVKISDKIRTHILAFCVLV